MGGLALAGFLLAACGGSGGGALSEPDFRREANAVCRSTRSAIAHLPKADAENPPALVNAGKRALAKEREAVRELAGLHAPTTVERSVLRWLRLVGRALDSVDASLRAQGHGDLAAASRANAEGSRLVTAADAAARGLRVSECATPAPK